MKKIRRMYLYGKNKNHTTGGTVQRPGVHQRDCKLFQWHRQHRNALLGVKKLSERENNSSLLRYRLWIPWKQITFLQDSSLFKDQARTACRSARFSRFIAKRASPVSGYEMYQLPKNNGDRQMDTPSQRVAWTKMPVPFRRAQGWKHRARKAARAGVPQHHSQNQACSRLYLPLVQAMPGLWEREDVWARARAVSGAAPMLWIHWTVQLHVLRTDAGSARCRKYKAVSGNSCSIRKGGNAAKPSVETGK